MDNNVVCESCYQFWVVQHALTLAVGVAAAAMVDDSRTTGLWGVRTSTYVCVCKVKLKFSPSF